MAKPSLRMGKAKIKRSVKSSEDVSPTDSTKSLLNSAKIANAASDFDEKKDNIQLKKFFPLSILPDPNNPRPKWSIDDAWLNRHLYLNNDAKCLVKIDEDGFDPVLRDSPLESIPSFDELANNPPESSRGDYEELRELAISIATVGQIQPIEVTLRTNDLYVVEGHLRRLACLLARRRVVIGVLNNTLTDKTERQILARQMAENGRRVNLRASELFQIGNKYLSTFKEETKPGKLEMSRFLGISRRRIGPLIDCMEAYPNGNKSIPVELLKCIEKDLVTQRSVGTIMGFKQFARRRKEALKLLQTEDPKAISKPAKPASDKFDWKPNSDNVDKLAALMLERFPELSTMGLDNVGNLKNLSKLMKAIESIAE